jgi:hypothetical protein
MEMSMDSIRFDSLARSLSTSDSRRGAFRALAATGLGLGLTRFRFAETDAKKKHKKSLGARCKKSDECKGDLLCKNANSQNSCYDQTERRCCKKIGAACDDSCDCCGVDVICNGGFCQGA